MRNVLCAFAFCVVGLVPAPTPAAGTFLVAEGDDSSPYSFLPALARGFRETGYAFTGDDEIGDSHNFRNFIRFDLSSIPFEPGEVVEEAFVFLTYGFDFDAFGDQSTVVGEINCHEVLEDWDEATLTWDNQPSFGPAISTQAGIEGLGLVSCDVPGLVQSWLTGARPNHGIVVTNPTERLIGFFTFESFQVEPALRPQLIVRTGPGEGGDGDGDGVPDAADNCPGTPNADQLDGDLDGTGDACDNCSALANGPLSSVGGAPQLDGDADGYGNVCDCDLDQNGTCNLGDFNLFFPDLVAGSDSGIGSDMDGSGAINLNDFNLFFPGLLEGLPGPSGLSQ